MADKKKTGFIMKRIICILLAFVILVILTACGASSTVPMETSTQQNTSENSPALSKEEYDIAVDALAAIDAFLDGSMSQSDSIAKLRSCSESFDSVKSESPDHTLTNLQLTLAYSAVSSFGSGSGLPEIQKQRNSLANTLGIDEIDYSAVPDSQYVDEDSLSVYPVTASADGLAEAPVECFTQYASENKLEGTPYYLIGRVSDNGIVDMNDGKDGKLPYFTLKTKNGKAVFLDLYHYLLAYQSDNLSTDEWTAPFQSEANSDYSFPTEVGIVKVVGIYRGFSDTNSAPTFIYGMPKVFMDTYAARGREESTGNESETGSQIENNRPANNPSYSANGISIRLGQPKYDKSWGGYYYTDLSIKNDSPSDIYYEVEYAKVNGFQLAALSFGDVYSGMSSSTQVSFRSDDMRLAKIDHILDVEMLVRIKESDSKRIIDTATLSLTTSDAGKYTQSYDFGWQEVYNENGLRVCARLGENSESFPAVFLIENNSGKTVSLSYNDIAINDMMAGQMMTGAQVVNGARFVTGLQRVMLEMMGGEIPENKDINSVALKLSFLPIDDDGSFSTANLYYSGKITISR